MYVPNLSMKEKCNASKGANTLYGVTKCELNDDVFKSVIRCHGEKDQREEYLFITRGDCFVLFGERMLAVTRSLDILLSSHHIRMYPFTLYDDGVEKALRKCRTLITQEPSVDMKFCS